MIVVDFWIAVIGLITWFVLKNKDKEVKNRIKERANAYEEKRIAFKERYVDYKRNFEHLAREASYKCRYNQENELLKKIYNDAKELFDTCNFDTSTTILNQPRRLMEEMALAAMYGKISINRYNEGYRGDEYKLMLWIKNNCKDIFDCGIVVYNDIHSKSTAYAWDGSRADPGHIPYRNIMHK